MPYLETKQESLFLEKKIRNKIILAGMSTDIEKCKRMQGVSSGFSFEKQPRHSRHPPGTGFSPKGFQLADSWKKFSSIPSCTLPWCKQHASNVTFKVSQILTNVSYQGPGHIELPGHDKL